MRVFAIKADEEQAIKVGSGEVKVEGDALGDDIMAGFEKNERLEDAARVINRVFTLCISDRYVELPFKSTHPPAVLSPIFLEHHLENLENGASITRRIFFSRRISRYKQPPATFDIRLHI